MTQPEKAPAPRKTKRDLRRVPRPRALSALGWRPAWLSLPSLPARGHGQGWSPSLPACATLPPGLAGELAGYAGPLRRRRGWGVGTAGRASGWGGQALGFGLRKQPKSAA